MEYEKSEKKKQGRPKKEKLVRMSKLYKGVISYIDVKESLVYAHEKEGWVK